MALITSISGIRGTLGGKPGDGLTPVDAVRFAAAFGTWVARTCDLSKIVIGRDARPSGEAIARLVGGTLQNLGIDVVDLGLATTPTVEMATSLEKAGGGIIITASHNPIDWNALKLLNSHGEAISYADGQAVLQYARDSAFDFVPVQEMGTYHYTDEYTAKHIALVRDYSLVDVDAIRTAKFRIVVDAVNSVGGIAVPALLHALGVDAVKELHCQPDGLFPHNPEPLPEHLGAIQQEMQSNAYDLGIVVDPDVDRLALMQEDGTPFGEEYTLVAIADYVLRNRPGSVVSNLSSTRALQDLAEQLGCQYYASAVGEVNVVEEMKRTNAVIGGEGNGGVIVPDFHYGRDALIAIALLLTHLAHTKERISSLRRRYSTYYISKKKITLHEATDMNHLFSGIKNKYNGADISMLDGIKINFAATKEWVHLRKSNTEPIIRVYAESGSEAAADALSEKIIHDVKNIV